MNFPNVAHTTSKWRGQGLNPVGPSPQPSADTLWSQPKGPALWSVGHLVAPTSSFPPACSGRSSALVRHEVLGVGSWLCDLPALWLGLRVCFPTQPFAPWLSLACTHAHLLLPLDFWGPCHLCAHLPDSNPEG